MSPPWMPLYVADYLGDTGHLGAAEHGAYLLLIMQYWQKGGLPDDDRQLARIARMTDRAFAAARPMLQAFFVEGWRHPRIEKELAKSAEKNDRRIAAGKEGGKASAALRQLSKQKGSNASSIAASNGGGNVQASSSHSQSEDTSLRSVSTRRARKPQSVRTPIAEDAQPTLGDREHAERIGMTSDVMRFEWCRFRDHHLKVASTFANWAAAWRTWCANWLERGGARHARAGPASADGLAAARQALRERTNGRDHHEADEQGAGGGDGRDRASRRDPGQQARAGGHDAEWDGAQFDLVAERAH